MALEGIRGQAQLTVQTEDEIAPLGQGRICAIANTSYCTWTHVSHQVRRSIQKLRQKGTWLCKVNIDGFKGFVQLIESGTPDATFEQNNADWPHSATQESC